MVKDQSLLRRAWPAGFLAVPGLATVGGWRCVSAATGAILPAHFARLYRDKGGLERGSLFPARPMPVFSGADLLGGDLLPAVDPEDRASWAVLLADVAEAGGLSVADAIGLSLQRWEQEAAQEFAPGGPVVVPGFAAWTLFVIRDRCEPESLNFFPDEITAAAFCGAEGTGYVAQVAPEVTAEEDPATALVRMRIFLREAIARAEGAGA